MDKVIFVGIVDDHPISRWGIQRALEVTAYIRVTGTYATADEVDPCADVMIVDLYLADELPCTALIRELSRRTRVLVVSASRLGADVEACFAAGAHGYLHKGSDPEAFAEAVSTVAAGGVVGSRWTPSAPAVAGPVSLSLRERQVLTFIASGYTHEQAARRLGISPHTVDTYVKRLRTKLGVGNKAHLTRAALRLYSAAG